MSRCFPFPPPGHVKNGIRDEAPIESIKREEEKAKKERKKEKKRGKKEKDRENGEIKSQKHSHKRRHKDEGTQEYQKVRDHQKRREDETEHSEKSSLTEEHGHPVGSQNSSDISLNSNKRLKQSLPPDDGHNSGSIIRIRLPLQRHKDLVVLSSKEQPCTSSGRIDDAPVHGMHESAPRPGREWVEHPCSTSCNLGPELTLRLYKEKKRSPPSGSSVQPNLKLSKEKMPSHSSGSLGQHSLGICKEKTCPSFCSSETFAHKTEAVLPSNLCGSCPPPLMLQFRNLIENWVPPPVQSECNDFDDQDWLFEPKKNMNCGDKKSCEVRSVPLNQGNSSPWPRVCFLPEADIYALPFTVPF